MNILKHLCVALSICFFFGSVNAQKWHESNVIFTSDQWTGYATSFSSDGKTIVVSSFNKLEKVKVFSEVNGNWVQIGEDIDWGKVVALSGDGKTVAIGHPTGNTNNQGNVTIYKNVNNEWTRISLKIKFINDQGTADVKEKDYFGRSIALSDDGSVLAIGASQFDKEAGYVKIFQNINDNYEQIGSTIVGEGEGDFFGYSISLSGDGSIVAVGAPNNDENGENSGQVKIFKNIDNNWTQIGSNINGEAATDRFGTSVSISSDGHIIAIGAPGNDNNGDNSGQVRIFENSNNVWTQMGSELNGENNLQEYFGLGIKVALSGDGKTVVALDEEYFGPGWINVITYKLENGVWLKLEDLYTNDDFVFSGIYSPGEVMGSISIDDKGEKLAVGIHHGSFPPNGLDTTEKVGDALMFYELKEVNNMNDLIQNISSIYPNPTLDLIYLDLSPECIGGNYEIFNKSGELLLEGKIQRPHTVVDLADLSKGYYLISIGKKKNQTFKILKK